MTLTFLVQGSAGAPYRLTAKGEGRSFRLHCTCPAGSIGGQLCKHATALMMGDVTNLLDPSDDVELLRRTAEGSPLLQKAFAHNPRPSAQREWPGIFTLEDVLVAFREKLVERGWEVVHRVTGNDRPSEAIELFARTSNGKLLKHPTVQLSWEKFAFDLVAQPDGSFAESNLRLRARPWGVRGKGGASMGTWRRLVEALPAFLDASGLDASTGRYPRDC